MSFTEAFVASTPSLIVTSLFCWSTPRLRARFEPSFAMATVAPSAISSIEWYLFE